MQGEREWDTELWELRQGVYVNVKEEYGITVWYK
jgi:hypothetical protein